MITGERKKRQPAPPKPATTILKPATATNQATPQMESQIGELASDLDLAPVHVSNLMRGFQGAVAKANDATRTGRGDGEDIKVMRIKNLEVSIDAPVVSENHAKDPVIMLPNANSVNNETARVSLRFTIVTVPLE